MNKLEINKDNYKGYVELYKIKKKSFEEEKNYFYKMFEGISSGAVLLLVILFGSALFLPVSNIFLKVILSVEIISYFFISAAIYTKYKSVVASIKKLENMKIDYVVDNYHCIDKKIELDKLAKMLEDAKILTRVKENDKYIDKLNIKEYEDYLKCEEIKKDYLEETKYDRYKINPEPNIEYVKLDSPKVKKIGALNRK